MDPGELAEFEKVSFFPGVGAAYGALTAKKGRTGAGAIRGEAGSLAGQVATGIGLRAFPKARSNFLGAVKSGRLFKNKAALGVVGIGALASVLGIGAATAGTRKK